MRSKQLRQPDDAKTRTLMLRRLSRSSPPLSAPSSCSRLLLQRAERRHREGSRSHNYSPIQKPGQAGERGDAEEHFLSLTRAKKVSPTSSSSEKVGVNSSHKRKKKRMKPALHQQQQACLPGRRPLLLPIAAAPCRRPTPRRYQCSAEVPRAGEGENEDEKPSTSSTSSSSQSPPPPPRPPPPDPEKRWRRLWGGNPHGIYRVPGVSDWFARAPQVRVRSRTDRQVRGKEAGMKESEKKKKKKKRHWKNDLFLFGFFKGPPFKSIRSNRSGVIGRSSRILFLHLIRIEIEWQEESKKSTRAMGVKQRNG